MSKFEIGRDLNGELRVFKDGKPVPRRGEGDARDVEKAKARGRAAYRKMMGIRAREAVAAAWHVIDNVDYTNEHELKALLEDAITKALVEGVR